MGRRSVASISSIFLKPPPLVGGVGRLTTRALMRANSPRMRRWLARNLLPLGYDYFHLDEGYAYARGEYTTANAVQFPHGMWNIEHDIAHLGLVPGIWTAPFYVSNRAWVFEHHPEWLVHDAQGKPIKIGHVARHQDELYVLDPTHPGAAGLPAQDL